MLVAMQPSTQSAAFECKASKAIAFGVSSLACPNARRLFSLSPVTSLIHKWHPRFSTTRTTASLTASFVATLPVFLIPHSTLTLPNARLSKVKRKPSWIAMYQDAHPQSCLDLRLQIGATDYGTLLQNEPSPIATSVIGERLTQRLVEEFNYIRSNAVAPLSKFLDYITQVSIAIRGVSMYIS